MKLILGLMIGLVLGLLTTGFSDDWLDQEFARRDQAEALHQLQYEQHETNQLLRQQRPC